ncbi:uncharacterized protein EDB91DRAFT_352090 [Suillus paluster]|uniref:uncharacterized protein n=1 Tax=Suillus paluster TaxID=48578 RepID=UPI001B867F78|nr:uncharacterized protein EDB91DRAFT_352090 [Suillus paluster]KAG1740486.1 hypothetical protein EDB91DRAFT_352090 [Suillus paluster]
MGSSLRLTVHNYSNDEGPTSSHSDETLELGRDLAHAASSNIGWKQPVVSFNTRLFELRHDRLYQFSVSPPRVPSAHRTHVLKDWGVPPSPSDDEEFVLEALEEFIHVKPEARRARPTLKRSAPPDLRTDLRDTQSRDVAHYRASSTNELSIEPPRKRFRHDEACIANLIPQPHFVAGPSAGFPGLDREHLRPYRKAPAYMIAPYDNFELAKLFMHSPYNRAAWLIPIRGRLPWDGAAWATITEPVQAPQRGDTPQLPSGPATQFDGTTLITWTRHSIVDFWKFMISIQQAKNLGPISLSFHAAPSGVPFTFTSSINRFDLTARRSNRPVQPAQSKASVDPSDDISDQIRHAQLESTDFIKVYHDAKYSLYLRNILDAYRYIPEATTSEGHPNNCETAGSTTKIRMLKGAQLVVVDNLSRAVLRI